MKPDEIEDYFVEDLFSEAPQDSRCEQFADYVLNTYITDTRFPPTVWAEEPSETKRTNNGAESFHAHFSSISIIRQFSYSLMYLEKFKQQLTSRSELLTT